MRKYISIIAIILFSLFHGISQDIHFSQINMVPLTINPSLTGVFYGDQRASLNYRDQWTGFGAGYRTYSFSFDTRILNKKWNSGSIGLGLNVFNDVAGDANLATTKALLSVSGIIDINSNQQIVAGIQSGIVQHSIDPSSLIWEDQYDPLTGGPTLQTNDYVNSKPFYSADLSVGVSWNYIVDVSTLSSYDATEIDAGFAMHHVNRSKLDFKDINSDKLYSKYIIHASSNIGINNTRLALKPGILIALQGPSKEILVGAILRYRLKEASKYTGFFSEQSFSIGVNYRIKDAIIPSLWFEAGKIALGISYDVNFSSLRATSNMRGGMEISLRFINPNPFSYLYRSKNPRFL